MKKFEDYGYPLVAVLAVVFLYATFSHTFAQNIPPVIPNTFVQDHAGVLDPADEQIIEQNLRQFKTAYDLEFAVATVRSTEPHPIEEYAIKMAREYGIGSKQGEKRGLMLLLATSDRKWRFEISRHMEGALTDGQSGTIGRSALVPKLKVASSTGNSADWREAILSTVAATSQVVAKNIQPKQEAVATPVPTNYTPLWVTLGILFLLGSFGGLVAVVIRHKRRVQEAIEAQQLADEIAIREEKYLRDRMAREAAQREQLKQEANRQAERALWLKTPEGVAWTKAEEEKERKLEKARQFAAEQEAIRQEAHRKWLLTPEGIADTQRKAEAAKVARQKREREQREESDRRRKREEAEEERRAARRRSESSSYSSSSSSDWSSSSSSSSSDSSSGFGGGGDFSGGGSSGSW